MDRCVLAAVVAMLCAGAVGACAQSPQALSSAPTADAVDGGAGGIPEAVAAEGAGFAVWLEGMKAEALAAGIRPATVEGPLARARFLAKTIELDRRQPEFNRSFGDYFRASAPESRVARGREMLQVHAALLGRLEQATGVPGPVLVALWGLETSFGAIIGSTPVIDTLATLAYEGRRGTFFKAQLLDALRILEAGDVPRERLIGSWAGAMGQTQFMPSTFVAHAVDGDGDGRRDPWQSSADALASGAAYLQALGWNPREPWGREIRLPPGLDLALTGLDQPQPVARWQALGVLTAAGAPLPEAATLSGAILLPSGVRGPAFIVYNNFNVILRWNKSIFYGLAAGYLADRLAGAGPLVQPPPPDDRSLRTSEVREIQQRLGQLGYDVGEPDGLIGARTRAAVRAFQAGLGRPADGYADTSVLDALRALTP